ncbi:MAG: primosome assembly protein PriA [Ornithinimicrobium sp.]|uniref:primosomal protein N' family DNA-binding protein n=1 Tax=Ornithinimicrobium sp. TaxID=1977084 RepID=UPI003D9B6817
MTSTHSDPAGAGDQLSLVPAPSARDGGDVVTRPVARVVIDTPLAHLDRAFEYVVPAELSDRVEPGVRVRVRFAGRDHDGFVLDRVASAEHAGKLAPVRRVVGEDIVLTPHLARVCRQVADHYAGTLSDVLRLAIPPRHARAEKGLEPCCDLEAPAAPPPAGVAGSDAAWQDYPAGPALLRRLAAGEGPAAAWSALPGRPASLDWPAAIAEAVAATLASGRGSVVVVPDHRDLARVGVALTERLGADRHVELSAALGPGARYRAWLSLLRGHRRVVVGTRATAYAPVRAPGLFVVWDDSDDLLREPRTPYPHVREILRLRAHDTGAGLLVAGFGHSVEVQHWVQQRRVHPVAAAPATRRQWAPRIVVAGEGHDAARDEAADRARIPSAAWRAVHDAVRTGPVLVQVPRRGYALAVQCSRCRHPVRCGHCGGPTQLPGPEQQPTCRWCGEPHARAPCPECGSSALRSAVVGEQRTAEEIGRAFVGVSVRTSRAGQVLAEVDDRPGIVVATPGAEPVAHGGYHAVLLLDGWALLDRPGLDAPIEAWRRWAGAAALLRRAPDARVVVTGVVPHGGARALEALVRWAPEWLLSAELDDRSDLGLPPVRRIAQVTGDVAVVADLTERLQAAPAGAVIEVLGPTTVPARLDASGETPAAQQIVLRSEGSDDEALVAAVRELRTSRSAHKAPGHVVAVLDPADIGV